MNNTPRGRFSLSSSIFVLSAFIISNFIVYVQIIYLSVSSKEKTMADGLGGGLFYKTHYFDRTKERKVPLFSIFYFYFMKKYIVDIT